MMMAMQQKIDLLLNPQAVADKPAIYKRDYIPWTSTDKMVMGFTEKKLLQANSVAIFSPNVKKDTITLGRVYTRSVYRYISEMAKECIHIPDSRAALSLAMGTDPSISLIIKTYCGTYKPKLACGADNPQDHWSFVCDYLHKNYKIDDGAKELKKQLLALRPEKETATNNALQVFQSQYLSLYSQFSMLTGEGEKSAKPFKDADEERDHILMVINPEIRGLYLNKHNMSPDETENTTLFWREILNFQRVYSETNDRKVAFKMELNRMEARPRDESQSYANPEDTYCYNCGKLGHYASRCPEAKRSMSRDRQASTETPKTDKNDNSRRDRSRDKVEATTNNGNVVRGRSRERQERPNNTNQNSTQQRDRSRSRDRRDSRGRTPGREDTERSARLNSVAVEAVPTTTDAAAAPLQAVP